MQLWDGVTGTLAARQSASLLHPPNTEPAEGIAVSVTTCPDVNDALHVGPHIIPGVLLVTVPLPLPVRLTFTVLGGIKVKFATQLCSVVIVTLPSTQSSSPLQPLKTES